MKNPASFDTDFYAGNIFRSCQSLFTLDRPEHAKKKRILLDGPTKYTISCPNEPINVLIRMEVD